MLLGVSVLSKFRIFGTSLIKNVHNNSTFTASKIFRRNLVQSRLFSTATEDDSSMEKLGKLTTLTIFILSIKLKSLNLFDKIPFLELIMQEVCRGDSEKENKMRVLMLELQIMKEDGRKAPDIHYLKKKHWENLIELPSVNARHKYLLFLFKNSKSVENSKVLFYTI